MKKHLISTLLLVIFVLTFSSFVMAQDVTLDFWIIGGRHQQETLNEIFDEFEEQTGIGVDLTVASEWEDLYQKVLVAVAGGNAPHLIRCKPFWIPELASRGALESMDEWIERDPDISINPDNFWPIRWEQSKYEGKMYSLPWTTFTELFFYNKEIFREAGIDGPPDTWEEFREYAKKTTDKDKMQYGSILYTYDRVSPAMTEFWEIMVHQAGGNIMNEDHTAFEIDSPEGLEALKLKTDMIYEDETILPPAFSEISQPVERGQIAMWWAGPWLFSSLPQDFPDLEWGAALAPKNKTRSVYATGNHLVMFKDIDNKEETWELLKFMFKKENDYKWNAEGGYLPSRRANIEKPPYTEEDHWQTQIEQFQRDDTKTRPYPLGFTEVQSKIAEYIQRAYLGEITPEEALRDAQKDANELLKELQ